MSVSKDYMQNKYGHLGELVVKSVGGKNRTCINMVCEFCGTSFLRPVYAMKYNKSFCSFKCNMTYYKPNSVTDDEKYLDFDGNYKVKSKCKSYSLWRDMLERSTSERFKEEKPTYKDVSLSESFKNFDFFHSWCLKQVGYGVKGFELDKDILIKGNKIYSEHTCCFVPKEINMLFVKTNTLRGEYPIGVYFHKRLGCFAAQMKMGKHSKACVKYAKTAEDAFALYKEMKENRIKFFADKYKHQIDSKVYNALYNYEVEITD